MLVDFLKRTINAPLSIGVVDVQIEVSTAICDRSIRKPTIRCRDCSIPNLYLDSTNVFATLDRPLAEIRTGTLLGSDIDAVGVSRFTSNGVDTT
ncbi:hypothetical protein HWV07_15625 [Natronomonas salina]|uniref:hypothetical protein n=1 Tax=Natronomonas salina TaxID=1710540 RepID=UPI0015B4E2C6|nr:hypothetical protein [Natronomonas salina]QLD90387.1 hypothetical protein HWV07_15625 [Natronomonas salina]